MSKNTDAMFDKFESTSNMMVGNIIGMPLLSCRMAQNAEAIRSNPNIKTEKERREFLIDDLTGYSGKLKDEGCLGYMFIDSYIENLKARQPLINTSRERFINLLATLND